MLLSKLVNKRLPSENDNEPVRNGNGVGVPSNLSMTKLQYTHSETHQDSRKGVKPEEEMLSNSQQEKKRNTENFKPCHDPTELRVMFSSGVDLYPRSIQTRDVIFVPDMFGAASDFSIYNKLHDELKNSGLTPHQVFSVKILKFFNLVYLSNLDMVILAWGLSFNT